MAAFTAQSPGRCAIHISGTRALPVGPPSQRRQQSLQIARSVVCCSQKLVRVLETCLQALQDKHIGTISERLSVSLCVLDKPYALEVISRTFGMLATTHGVLSLVLKERTLKYVVVGTRRHKMVCGKSWLR